MNNLNIRPGFVQNQRSFYHEKKNNRYKEFFCNQIWKKYAIIIENIEYTSH